jgi:hypothetical protein
MHCIIKKMITPALALSMCGAAGAQTQPGTPDIGKLTNQAMKISIGVSAATAGVAVIGLIVKHHHSKKASEKSAPAQEKPNAGTTATPSNPSPLSELTGDRRR